MGPGGLDRRILLRLGGAPARRLGCERARRGGARFGRHEAVGNRQLVAAERPTPGDVLRAVGAIQVGIAAHHIRALSRYAMEDIAVDAVCATPGGGTLQPGDELACASLVEQVLGTLPERERRSVGGPQGVVVDETPVQAPADLPVMIHIVPAGVAQLGGVALAELVQDGRATDPRPAGVRGQAIWAVGLEPRQVEKAQRPASVHRAPRSRSPSVFGGAGSTG